MALNSKFVQKQSDTLAGSGAVAGATSITLNAFYQIDGVTPLTMTDFGARGYGTLEPNNGTQEEAISFTGITANANGTFTLTGVSTVLFVNPYTETSGLAKSHPGGVVFVITNSPALYNHFVDKDDTGTINQVLTFDTTTGRPTLSSDVDTSNATDLVSLGQMSRQAISGASNMSLTVKGIAQAPHQSDIDNKSTTGSTGALFAVTPDKLRATKYNDYVLDTGSVNAFAIAPSPVVTLYTSGLEFRFKAKTANTGACTLAVNGLSAVSIKLAKLDPRSQAITTNSIVGVVYDSVTNTFRLQGSHQPQVSQDGGEIYGVSTTGNTAYVVALSPVLTKYVAGLMVNFKPDTAAQGGATININGLGAKTIKRNGVSGLSNTDIPANQIAKICYDGVDFQLQNTQSVVGKVLINTTSSGNITGTAEKVIASAWIPGLTLGTNNGIRVKCYCSTMNLTTTNTGTFKFYYGGTVVVTTTIGGGTGATGSGFIEAVLFGAGTTSSQQGSLLVFQGNTAGGQSADATGTSSIDSTLRKNIQITVAFSTSSGSDAVQVDHFSVERIL